MILIISNRQDVTADFVVRQLTQRGEPFCRLNTEEFPVNGTADAWFGLTESPSPSIRWRNRPHPVSFREIRSVWYRRPIAPLVDAGITDEGIRKFATDESYELLRGLWYNLKCYWMSPPDAIRRAEHKLVQLRAAEALGFHVPKTVVTNSPDAVRDLASMCPSGIIAKPLFLGFVRKEQQPAYIYTTRLKQEHIADRESIMLAPAIYQQYIAKLSDIRVTVVGDTVFAARIVASELPSDIPDWRYTGASLKHHHHDLPDAEAGKCCALVKGLGLDFGAIDFALTADGQYFFLEINPNGQWAWLETELGLPISASIAERLIAHAR